MAENSNAPLIVKKVKKVSHGGHHGGSWKVAYADFVTAMMAFFLLLWLLNATTEKQKIGLAEYFSPVVGTMGHTSGGDGFFGGDTVTSQGKLISNKAPMTISIPIPTTAVTKKSDEGDSSLLAKAESPHDTTGDTNSDADAADGDQSGPKDNASASPSPKSKTQVDETQAEKVIAKMEDKDFNKAEHMLRQAIQDVPELKELAQNLIVDKTPEGLRIQIVDQQNYAMFPRGSAVMNPKARLLMTKVAEIIEKLPEKISITGHTDSTPYANGKGYDNWDLSTDRANASRRALIQAGLPPDRIATMTGRADKDPLVKNDPSSPKNRRISIVLLRDSYLKKAEMQPDDGPVQGNASAAKSQAQTTPPASPQASPQTGDQTAQAPGPGNAPPTQSSSGAAPAQPTPGNASPASAPTKAAPAKASPTQPVILPPADGRRSDAAPTGATPAKAKGVVYLEPADGPNSSKGKTAARDSAAPTPTDAHGVVMLAPSPKS